MKISKVSEIFAKLIIAGLLVGCLFKMPYGYYQFMRIAVCLLFAVIAYLEYKKGVFVTAILCGFSVILFNPIAKFYFHKKDWQIIDKGFVIALMIWIIIDVISIIKNWRHNKTPEAKALRLLTLMRKLYDNPEMTEQEMLEKIEMAKQFKESKQKPYNDKK